MRTVLVLVGNEFRRFAADKAAFSLTFIVPLVLIYIFGNVFGVNSEDRGPKGIPLAVVNQTDAPAPAVTLAGEGLELVAKPSRIAWLNTPDCSYCVLCGEKAAVNGKHHA